MVDAGRLRTIFPFPRTIDSSVERLYDIMKRNYKDLEKVGHNLWMSPINLVADWIVVATKLDSRYQRESIINLAIFINNAPKVHRDSPLKTINEFAEYMTKHPAVVVKESKELSETFEAELKSSFDRIEEIRKYVINFLHAMIIGLRYMLAPKIIEANKNVRIQKVADKEHPIYQLFTAADFMEVRGGAIGDGLDTKYTKSLISSNDISALLIKLKTLYMRMAALQLIQTLSQLAEKKSYQTITFRQDELRGVIEQVRKLSSDTFKQLKTEDEIISKICYNIIKSVDPTADMAKTIEALSVDIGIYPAHAFSLMKQVYP